MQLTRDRYIVRQYGHKWDVTNRIYRVRVILERVEGQVPIEELSLTPTPAQLDDWELYHKVMGEDIRARDGFLKYNQWMVRLEQDAKRRREWLLREEQQVNFLSSVGLTHG